MRFGQDRTTREVMGGLPCVYGRYRGAVEGDVGSWYRDAVCQRSRSPSPSHPRLVHWRLPQAVFNHLRATKPMPSLPGS